VFFVLTLKIASKTFSRILVTGNDGFVGQHVLADWPEAIGLSSLASNIDIRDKYALLRCLSSFQPAAVLHLAAISFVPDSVSNPEQTYEVNFLGTLRLLQALTESGFKGRFVFVGSGDTYGLVTEADLPIVETQPLRPRNPYAVSKVAAEALCYQWSQTASFDVMMARPFNHIGSGQAPTFAISDFAKQIAEISAGLRAPEIHVGNLDATRDFCDVKDIVNAYRLMLGEGKNGEVYNICSGIERPIRALLGDLLRVSGVSAEIVLDPARSRASEQPRVRGSNEKLACHTGWQPTVSMDQTLLNIYRYWEQKIGK
jgi:GDP-4-dehydro-6-deoxy-D-mannose reductase